MTSLFDDIAQFDDGFAANRREAAAVAHKRVQDTVGGYLRLSKSAEEYTARLNYVTDDIRQIVADVASEYNVDHDKLLNAIEENLKGDGVTDINVEMLDAPSAVGTGPKEAGGHKDGCECGFCKNKGNIHKKDDDSAEEKVEGIVDDEEKADKDASEPEFSEKVKEGKIAAPMGPDGSYQLPEYEEPEIYVRTKGGNLLGPFHNEEEAKIAKEEEEADELYRHGDPNVNPGEMPEGYDPRVGSSHVAGPSRDGGGAVTREKLPKGDGKSIGDGPSPKIDKKRWKPNALNADGNLPAVPKGIEMDGSPVPTERQDLVDEERDYSRDFEDKIDAATTTQDLPSADETGASTERNVSQDNQMGSWTEGPDSAVTPQVFANVNGDDDEDDDYPKTISYRGVGGLLAASPQHHEEVKQMVDDMHSRMDREEGHQASSNEGNPLKAILDAGFASDNQVESAIASFDSKE